ncbi:MAG TPA: carboxypeptidase regulatory-like domain-containing protein [Bryobacteraceae bacterium]|jgi:plastocyanin|nr:carboxypeptidase regulatory-like domain-containing protein [Bryobacteraceae bacterium]
MTACSKTEHRKAESKAEPAFFKVDPGTAATVTGTIHYTGKKPRRKPIDMSGDPACMEAHHGKAYDESLVVNANHTLANVFVYVKSGLEGKVFETPTAPAVIDQQGCWFRPRILGIQTGQILRVTNSDPVTHNIHPLAQVNREWNHSQGAGDEPLARKFARPEIMIRVKCNIHSWMRAYIGVLGHPYFAVTGEGGTFDIPNLPPGDYVIEAWHEALGTQEQHVKVTQSAKVAMDFTFKGD